MSEQVRRWWCMGVESESCSGRKPAGTGHRHTAVGGAQVHLIRREGGWWRDGGVTSFVQGVPRETGGSRFLRRISPWFTLKTLLVPETKALSFLARNLGTRIVYARDNKFDRITSLKVSTFLRLCDMIDHISSIGPIVAMK